MRVKAGLGYARWKPGSKIRTTAEMLVRAPWGENDGASPNSKFINITGILPLKQG